MDNRSSKTTTSSDGSDSMFVKDRKSDQLATPLSPPKTTGKAIAAPVISSFLSPATVSGNATGGMTAGGTSGGSDTQVSRWSYSTTDGDNAGKAALTKAV